jgi:putative transposase
LARGKRQKDDGPPSILRCDTLPTFMNPSKARLLDDLLRSWRAAAVDFSRIQWRLFFEDGKFEPLFDPAKQYRKQTVVARTGILRQIAARHDLVVPEIPTEPEDEKKKPKRLAAMAPGLVDVLAPYKADLGAAQVQMVMPQVMGTLDSYISNRQNDFVELVFNSSLAEDETVRHMLFTINRAKAWFELKRSVKVNGKEVPMHLRRLARKIMSHLMKVNRQPRFHGIGMVVDQRIAVMHEATKAKSFDFWLRLTVAKGHRIDIPVNGHDYFRKRKGERKLSFQINRDRETGRYTVGVITDVGEAFAASRQAYLSKAGGSLALDFGLRTLFATDRGDLVGRDFIDKLKSLDATIQGIARHVQRSGCKPRSSKRFVQHVTRTRGFVESEIRRVLNRLIALRKPTRLFLERLDFRSPELSARMNRLLQNCGRSVVKAKLQSLSEEYGVEATEVASPYTSQTCSCCGYVDRRNRRKQARFACLWCGNKMHADVNAARNIGSERFRAFGSVRAGARSVILNVLVDRHVERFYERKPGAPSDPRRSNPHFKGRTIVARCLPIAA